MMIISSQPGWGGNINNIWSAVMLMITAHALLLTSGLFYLWDTSLDVNDGTHNTLPFSLLRLHHDVNGVVEVAIIMVGCSWSVGCRKILTISISKNIAPSVPLSEEFTFPTTTLRNDHSIHSCNKPCTDSE